MGTHSKQTLPTLFWMVAIAAIIWNALGVVAYLTEVTLTEEALAALPEAQQALYAAQPAWVTAVYAIAVFTGLGGSIALAMRNGLAISILVVSFVAVIIQMSYALVFTNMIDAMGVGSAVMPALIIVVAAALVWFSTYARSKGWIR
jgi:hypothetical protein